MKTDEHHIRKNPLPRLLTEAALLLEMDSGPPPDDWMQRAVLAKASIANSALVIECAATCCVELLITIPAALRSHAERLPPLQKCAMLYSARTGKSLDKGGAVYQRAADIIKLRDSLVHAKVTRTSGALESKGGHLIQLHESGKPQRSEWPCLKLPEDSWNWREEHARKIFVHVIEFLNWFFIDQCGLAPSESALFLGSSAGGDFLLLQQLEADTLRRASAKLGVPFRFLNILEEPGPQPP